MNTSCSLLSGLFIVLFFFELNFECESADISLPEKEIECLSQSKLYHRESDKCYKLLTRGPCAPGFWFVLEKPKKGANSRYFQSTISPICAEEKCPEGGYYWASEKRCVQPKDKNFLCRNSSEEELLNNVFGEAECMCARDPVRARVKTDEKGRCYQLYTQGPCRPGEVVGYIAGDLDKATCIQDKCYEETLRKRSEGSLPRDGVLAPWRNGSCYELGTQGPCPDTLKFKVHKTVLQPTCITLTNAIFELATNCYEDENGDCQKPVKTGNVDKANKYKSELLSALNEVRKKRKVD